MRCGSWMILNEDGKGKWVWMPLQCDTQNDHHFIVQGEGSGPSCWNTATWIFGEMALFEHVWTYYGVMWYLMVFSLVSFHQLSRPRQYVGICRAAWQIILESRHRRRFARFDSGNSSSDGSKSLSASSSAFLLPGSLIYYDISGMSKHGRTKDLILAWKHLRCQL